MRVALLHGWLGGPGAGGGGSRHMLDLALRLQALGHHVTVATYDYDPGSEFNGAAQALEIRSVRRGGFHASSGKRAALRRFWQHMPRLAAIVPADVEIIHAHEWPALHAARLAGSRLGVPFVWSRNDHTIWERAILPGIRNDASAALAGRVLRAAGSFPDLLDARRASAIVCLDNQSRRMVERAYGRSAEVIPAPPADHFFSPPERGTARLQLGIALDAFLVLAVGIMNPHRRFEDLVDAISLVPDSRVKTLIVGSDHVDPAYGRRIRERVERARLADSIMLATKTMSEDDLRAAYSAADLFVFPNDHRQSWGLAPLEALASGTPVIITRAAGVADAISGLAGVTVVDAHAPSQIASAIASHVRATGPIELGNTRDFVRDQLGGRRHTERITSLYERVIADPRPRS